MPPTWRKLFTRCPGIPTSSPSQPPEAPPSTTWRQQHQASILTPANLPSQWEIQMVSNCNDKLTMTVCSNDLDGRPCVDARYRLLANFCHGVILQPSLSYSVLVRRWNKRKQFTQRQSGTVHTKWKSGKYTALVLMDNLVLTHDKLLLNFFCIRLSV